MSLSLGRRGGTWWPRLKFINHKGHEGTQRKQARAKTPAPTLAQAGCCRSGGVFLRGRRGEQGHFSCAPAWDVASRDPQSRGSPDGRRVLALTIVFPL